MFVPLAINTQTKFHIFVPQVLDTKKSVIRSVCQSVRIGQDLGHSFAQGSVYGHGLDCLKVAMNWIWIANPEMSLCFFGNICMHNLKMIHRITVILPHMKIHMVWCSLKLIWIDIPDPDLN